MYKLFWNKSTTCMNFAMVIKLSVLLVLIYSISSKENNYDDRTIDWTAFEVKDFVKHDDSIEFIKSLPLNQYWDASKSSFRTGILAEKILHLHPKLVTAIDKKVTLTAKLHTVATHVVDTSLVFMHSLSALQSLIISSENLKSKIIIPDLYKTYPQIYSKLNEVFAMNIKDNFSNASSLSTLPSLPHLISKKTYFESKLKTIQNTLTLVSHRQYRRLEHVKLFHRLKKEQIFKQQIDMINSIQNHYYQLNYSNVMRFERLQEIREQTQQNKLKIEIESMQNKYQDDINYLQNELNLTLSTIAYRTEEEIKILKQQEEFEKIQLLDMKLDLLKSEVDLILNTIFNELLDTCSILYKDPWLTLSYLKYAIGCLICLMLFFELLQLVIFIAKSLTSKKYISKKTLNIDNNYSKKNMIFSSEIKAQFQLLVDSINVSLKNHLPMPNIIITGPSGCGKSTISQILLNELSNTTTTATVPYVVICGGDLKSLGNNSALYLNDMLSKAIKTKTRLIIVLDEADMIVQARSQSCISTDGCLFSILNGIRESSEHLSLIITSRLKLSCIDNALLDRMDLIMDMSLPKKAERLEYALHILKDNLLEYISEEEKAAIDSLCKLGNINLSLEYILNVDIQIPELFSSTSKSFAPELDRPLENDNIHDHTFAYIKENMDMFTRDHFEVNKCLKCMICLSEDWSYRDLKQFLFGVKYAVMCNENCRLSTINWMKELIFSFD